MAGTVTCGTISDGTNSTSSTNCIQGSAKAWVNFNGTNAAIRASYNVSSVTRSSTGDYTVNMTTALSDANYTSVITSGSMLPSSFAAIIAANCSQAPADVAPTTTAMRFSMRDVGNTARDSVYLNVAVFR